MVVSKHFMVYTLYNLYGGLQFISGNGEATITPENLKLRFLIILIGCMYGIYFLGKKPGNFGGSKSGISDW